MKSRQQWAAMLAKLVAPMDAPRAGKALADMLPMLQDFPDSAFCLDSLEAVAAACKFPPSYAELREHLGAWWKAHRPHPVAIAASQPATVRQREIDQEVEESWATITPRQIHAKVRALEGHPMRAMIGSFLASALRKHAPHHLGLLPPEWLTDDAEPASVVALRQPPPERKPATLSPEQLTAIRAAAIGISPQVRKGPRT
jgi:hypothetical protein